MSTQQIPGTGPFEGMTWDGRQWTGEPNEAAMAARASQPWTVEAAAAGAKTVADPKVLTPPEAQKRQVHRVRMWILAAMVIVIGGIFAWSYLFTPASKDDASDAYYACVDVMNREVVNGSFDGPGDQTYTGHDGAWTITGTFVGAMGDPIPYTCKATRVSAGRYSITWS